MLTILPDFREEGWHSMDLCSEKLLENLPPNYGGNVELPKYRKFPGWLRSNRTRNIERWYNRWLVYPKHVRSICNRSGFFHLVDHSYAHLLHYLPAEMAGVYCHDLDAFKSILMPSSEPRPAWYRQMMARVFSGFKRARVVFCNSEVTRKQVLELGIWPESDVVLAPLGVAEEYVSDGQRAEGNFILNVGSCIPRKRIDLLLEIFALVRREVPDLRLVQAGGVFSTSQLCHIQSLGLEDAVDQVRNLSRQQLASLYRGSKALLVTSDSEGFGLPVIEGLACGTKVVATEIPALLEAGGKQATYFPAGNARLGSEAVLFAISGLCHGGQKIIWENERHCWKLHAKIIAATYSRLNR